MCYETMEVKRDKLLRNRIGGKTRKGILGQMLELEEDKPVSLLAWNLVPNASAQKSKFFLKVEIGNIK